MKRFASLLALLSIFGLLDFASAIDDWPIWRGPNRNNVAPGNQMPPTKWDEKTNVIWKAEVPGRGHASPVMVGNKIFLATAEKKEQIQSVVCYSKDEGKQLWQTKVNQGNFSRRIHGNNTHASQTIVCGQDQLFVVFNNHSSIQLAALDFDGNLKWQKKTGDYRPLRPFGYGSSPCLYKNLVIVLSDTRGNGYIAAFDQQTGEEVWRTARGETGSYATPIVGKINGQDQLIVSGTNVSSYNPATGKKLWKVDCPWETTCGTLVWDGDLVFVGGGYPARVSLAVSASKQNIVWQKPIPVYEQSLIVKDGYVFAHADTGVAYCWRGKDGKEMWKSRVTTRGVSASPVLVGDLIYMTGENGDTVIIKANPNQFEKVASNKLGGESFATPVFVDNRIYTRVGKTKRSSPQMLYCLGKE